MVADACQSFALDNGAFSVWRSGAEYDWDGYIEWARLWLRHPGCDWAVIPDVIDGGEAENDALIARWPRDLRGVPVWHLHEGIDRLRYLAEQWPRVAFGSSGAYQTPGSGVWWARMAEAMDMITIDGSPICQLHGLRMLDPAIFTALPFSSADSTNAARNAGNGVKWTVYAPREPWQRAGVIADRIESYNSAATWSGSVQECLAF